MYIVSACLPVCSCVSLMSTAQRSRTFQRFGKLRQEPHGGRTPGRPCSGRLANAPARAEETEEETNNQVKKRETKRETEKGRQTEDPRGAEHESSLSWGKNIPRLHRGTQQGPAAMNKRRQRACQLRLHLKIPFILAPSARPRVEPICEREQETGKLPTIICSQHREQCAGSVLCCSLQEAAV